MRRLHLITWISISLLLIGCNLTPNEEDQGAVDTIVAESLTEIAFREAFNNPTPKDTPTPPVRETPEITPTREYSLADYEGWQAYSNLTHGYTLRYPGNAVLRSADERESVQFEGPIVGADHWPWFFIDHLDSAFFRPPANTEVGTWITEAAIPSDGELTRRLLASLPAVQLVNDPSPQAYGADHFYFIKDEQLFHLTILHTGGNQDWELYEKFLQSITFDAQLPTLTPTLQITPTSTPSLGTPSARDPDLPTGNPSWIDTFTSDANWPLYQDDHVEFTVDEGKLIMKAFNADYWDGWMITWPELQDFYLAATFSISDACAGLDRYGIMARATKPDKVYIGYQLGISCDGRYIFREWDGKRYQQIVPWTVSEELRARSYDTHTLGLLAEGDTLAFFINGKRIAEIQDETYEAGKFGLFIGAAQTEDFTVKVEEIAYWILP